MTTIRFARAALPCVLSLLVLTACTERRAPLTVQPFAVAGIASKSDDHTIQSLSLALNLVREVLPYFPSVKRNTVTIGAAGVLTAFRLARELNALSLIDRALLGRLNVFALPEGSSLSWWLGKEGGLLALVVRNRGHVILCAGARSGDALYDERGHSLDGPLWVRPVMSTRISSRFGERLHPIRRKNAHHDGIDYPAPVGTKVHAVGDGEVVSVGSERGAGRFVIIRHAAGYESRYLHLSRFSKGLTVGKRLRQGDVIATSGNTGRSTGPHVHFELRLRGSPVDPQNTLPVSRHALGPLALKEHRAFLLELEETHL